MIVQIDTSIVLQTLIFMSVFIISQMIMRTTQEYSIENSNMYRKKVKVYKRIGMTTMFFGAYIAAYILSDKVNGVPDITSVKTQAFFIYINI